MDKINCRLSLELNLANKLIFSVKYNSKNVAIILFEDLERPGELFRDFAFLHPNYYSSEEEWDDFRNLIKATIFIFDNSITANSALGDELIAIAENMIEEKPNVNHLVEYVYDKELVQLYYDRNDSEFTFLNYILSLCENKESISFNRNELGHIVQFNSKPK